MDPGSAAEGRLELAGAELWVAVTDKIGHINQCAALTDALGATPDRVALIPGFNLRHGRLMKLVRRGQGWARSLALLPRLPRGPLALVISGRSSEYAASILRWRLGRRLFVISVGPPINRPAAVDIAVMNEASLPKWRARRACFESAVDLEEVLICGALARRFGATEAAAPPGRLLAVLIGGENKSYSLTGATFRQAMERIAALAGAWRIEAALSRRTSAETERIVREALSGAAAAIHGRGDSAAYRELLDRGDCFVVTPDSVTMLSEVCLGGKPVYALDLDVVADSDGEGERLVEAMAARGVVRRFAGEIEVFTPDERLDEAARIAPLVAERINAWRRNLPDS